MKTYCLPAVLLALSGCALFNPGGRTVRVSDFGHDGADSTRYLQAALDSGADTVIVDARHWVTLPLRVRSDQEIVLEKGAVIEAKKGEYLGKYDSVLNFVGVSNVVLRGDGEIRMWHDDYLKPPYAKAEWRHCVNILGCDKVTIRGLRLLQGGGDGVYVGALTGGRLRSWRMTTAHPWSSNIVLEDLYIDTHVRQGMSVTSCKGLTADRCVFKNTWGLPPEAGVDLEPNSPDNPITGMVFRDCTFENNKGAGFEFALGSLNPMTSEPFDCRFERCRFVRNNLTVHNIRRDHSQIGGKLVVQDCVFVEPREMPLAVGMTPDRPFEFSASGCRIVEKGVETAIDDAWLLRNAPLLAPGGLVSCERTKVDFSALKVVDPESGVPHELARMKFRNRVRFAVFADRARKLEFRGGLSVLGSYKPKKELSPLVIEDVEGKQIAEIELPVMMPRTRHPFHSRRRPAAFISSVRKWGAIASCWPRPMLRWPWT